MCVTCGCSDDNAKITHPQTGEVVVVDSDDNNHHHTHTLPDGRIINHSHSEDKINDASIHAKIHNTTI